MKRITLILAILILVITGCQGLNLTGDGTPLPTLVSALPMLTPSPETVILPALTKVFAATVPPTWTPLPANSATPHTRATPAQTITTAPTRTAFPTLTAVPTVTETPPPSATVNFTATEVAISTPTLTPTLNAENLLPNPSFELGWYHLDGISELQIPSDWFLGWHEGKNDLDSDPWNAYVRPESRILSGDFLPADEHELYIWDGARTVKVFKRTGALYFWLATNVQLEPGSYLLEINVFPDMVDDYTELGGKVWAPDPLSAELRFIHDGEVGNWIFPVFGQVSSYRYAFQVDEPALVRLGAAFRGRWAILNNGWFLDDWSLIQLSAGP